MTARQTARRRRVVVAAVFGAMALAATGAAGCRQDDAPPAGSSVPVSEPATSLPATSLPATSLPVTSAGATSAGATSGGSTPTTVGVVTNSVATTVGDLLTEAEVAEVEQVLDDLDALLGEIDADLAGVPDP